MEVAEAEAEPEPERANSKAQDQMRRSETLICSAEKQPPIVQSIEEGTGAEGKARHDVRLGLEVHSLVAPEVRAFSKRLLAVRESANVGLFVGVHSLVPLQSVIHSKPLAAPFHFAHEWLLPCQQHAKHPTIGSAVRFCIPSVYVPVCFLECRCNEKRVLNESPHTEQM